MGHTANIAGEHQTREAERGKLGKGAADVPPGGGEASLWVLGELLTRKVPSQRTGGGHSPLGGCPHPRAGAPPPAPPPRGQGRYLFGGGDAVFLDGHPLGVLGG